MSTSSGPASAANRRWSSIAPGNGISRPTGTATTSEDNALL
jgi:hypothetical protein